MSIKIRNKHDKALVAEELRRRQVARTGILGAAFSHQQAFIEDPSRLKAALCTRRSGKSFASGLYIFKEALQNPGCNILYLGLSYQSAKRIIIKDIFEFIARKFSITITVNYSDLSIRFPNGSVVYVSGGDANEKARAKFLGQKYRLVVIDEAAEWKTDMISLIYSTLKPAMVDNDGTIIAIGVPGNIQGFFYDVTTKARDPLTNKLKFPGWSIHNWSGRDNPFIAKRWNEELQEILKEDPGFADSPIYKQQYLGQWVVDPDAACYSFDETKNVIDELPGDPKKDYEYIMGIDLGWNDPSAFVVIAQPKEPGSGMLYVTHAWKRSAMLPDDIADKIHELESEYDISRYVIDPASKTIVQDLIQRHGIPLESATKGTHATRKNQFISMCSGDLKSGKIKLVAGPDTAPLAEEWKKLVWDKSDRYNIKEHGSCENHLSDAFLYAWTECSAFNKKLESPAESKPAFNSNEWGAHWEKTLAKRLTRKSDFLSELDNIMNEITKTR